MKWLIAAYGAVIVAMALYVVRLYRLRRALAREAEAAVKPPR